MAALVAVPLKKTNEVDLFKPLKTLISTYCSTADEPAQYDNALTELNKLRMNSTWRTLDKHESSLGVMTRYYDQLNFLEAKCPTAEIQHVSEGEDEESLKDLRQINDRKLYIPFKWKDAFDKGSFFSGSMSLTLSSLAYEKLCILFNIAAMQSQIAASHGNDSRNDEGLKSAAKYFQMSSGIFQHLKICVSSVIGQDPTPDLHPDTLNALHVLMLAQAQESIFYKAAADNMKSSIIAKIAAQCEELYADALKQMQREADRVMWEKDWLPLVAGKQAGFHALSEYYQSLVCKAKKEVGEEIARLQHASELMKAAESRAGLTFTMKDYINKINLNLEEAKKDNDFIYHARVPDVRQLSPIDRAALAKPTALPEKLNPNSEDLFSALLPVAVQQAVQAFDLRKTEIVNTEISRLREQTLVLNGILASLNLPAAIEDTTGDTLPHSLKEKADAIRSKGGIEAIQRLIEDLPELLQRNREIIEECQRMLNEEEESDNQMRSQFKKQWTRTASSKLNQPLKANLEKYFEIINCAVSADGVVKEKFSTHKDNIILLCKPEEELLVPTGSPVSSNSPNVEQLKKLMEEVETLRAERETIESEFKSSATDMKAKFLSALSESGHVNEQALSVETLGEIYGPLQKQARDSLAKQEQLITAIQNANSEFCKEKNTNQSASQRESILSELAAAHDAYMELIGNLEEGTKFYNKLTEILVSFQNKINDFCFARKTEKDELFKDVQKNIVSAAQQPAPAQPAHHAAIQKPQRPPPPAVSSGVTSTPTPAAAPYPTSGSSGAPSSNQPNPPYPVYPSYPYPYTPLPSAYNPYLPPQPYVHFPPGYQGGPQPGQYATYPLPTASYPYPQQQYQPWQQQ